MNLSTLTAALMAVALLAPAASAQSRLVPTKPVEQTLASETSNAMVLDGSFEGGIANTSWTQTSTNYTTVICSVVACGAGAALAAGPRTGTFYVWFSGGAATTPAEAGSIQQSVTTPAGPATLKFWLRIPAYPTPPAPGDNMRVSLDGTTLATYTYAANQAAFAQYTQVSLPVTATGAPQVLRFEQSNAAGAQVSYFLDDVTLEPVVTGPGLSSSTTALSFGTTTLVGQTSAPQTVTLTNSGTTPTTVTTITSSNPAFAVTAPALPLTLAANATATFTVRFTPTDTAPATGTVTVVSDAPTSPLVINLSGTGLVPPPNDNRANATVIAAPGTVSGTNVGATLEAGEPVPSCQVTQGASVWWTYTPTATGTVSVDLSATGTLDTVLTLYAANGTTEIACDDDSGAGNTSFAANVPVTAGQQIYIRVAGFGSTPATGALSFTVTQGGPLVTSQIPPGTTVGGSTLVRPLGATTCTQSTTATAVAYRSLPFTVDATSTYNITTAYPVGFNGYIVLYTAPFDAATTCANRVAFDDDFATGGLPGTQGSQIVAVPLTAGTSYVLVVTGFNNAAAGDFTGTVVGPGIANFLPVASEGIAQDARTFLSASPNPATSSARVRFASAEAQTVSVAVYDVTGRQVATLFQGAVAADQLMDLALNTSSLAPGVYVVRATGTSLSLTQRVTVVR